MYADEHSFICRFFITTPLGVVEFLALLLDAPQSRTNEWHQKLTYSARDGFIHFDDVIAGSFPFIWNLAVGASAENSLRLFKFVGSFQFGGGG